MTNKFECLLFRIRTSGFKTYDPGSIHLFITEKKYLNRKLRVAVSKFLREYGCDLIYRTLRVEKIKSTKALALTLMALHSQKKQTYAAELIHDLLNAKSRRGNYWESDFPVATPKGTFTGNEIGIINTLFSLEALWVWRDTLDTEQLFLDVITNIVTSQRVLKSDDRHMCFTYNNDINYCVHNSNILIALNLLRATKIRPNEEFKSIARKIIAYQVDDFLKVGYLRYAGEPYSSNHTDNYHVGYVIRALNEILIMDIYDQSFAQQIDHLIKKSVRFYVEKFVYKGNVTKVPNRTLLMPHALAESMLLLSSCEKHFDTEDSEKLKKAILKTEYVLWDSKKGKYRSNINRFGFKNTANMIRWNDAWMLYALSMYTPNEF